MTNLEIEKTGIKDFDHYAKRYHIDYAIQKDQMCIRDRKSTVLHTKYSAFLVENSGIEPLTSCMPCKRSPS